MEKFTEAIYHSSRGHYYDARPLKRLTIDHTNSRYRHAEDSSYKKGNQLSTTLSESEIVAHKPCYCRHNIKGLETEKGKGHMYGLTLLFPKHCCSRSRRRTTTHDRARPRTITYEHYHARPRPRTTAHDHARPRTTMHVWIRRLPYLFACGAAL